MSSTIWIILGIITFFIVLIIGLYHNLTNLNQKVKNAWTQIDIQLTKQFDLIPDLVEMIKKYTDPNQNDFTSILEAINKFKNTNSIKEKIHVNNILTSSLKSVFSLIGPNSKLKTNQDFIELEKELKTIQDNIDYSKQFYNDFVQIYNTAILKFPSNILAKILNLKEQILF